MPVFFSSVALILWIIFIGNQIGDNGNTMMYFQNFPNSDELGIFKKELKECFEKFRKASWSRALKENINEDADALVKSLNSFANVLIGCYEKTSQLIDASIDDWRINITLHGFQSDNSPILNESFSQLHPLPQSFHFLTSMDKKNVSPGFYRQMDKDQIRFLCYVGNNASSANAPGSYFNHKIPIDQVEMFVSFFTHCRDKEDAFREKLGFVDFMKFSCVSDSLLKFSKQHPNLDSEKMRLNWLEKSDKKTSDKSFKIFKKPEILCFLPVLYVYQCRDVLNFLLERKLVVSGTRGQYKASENLNETSLRSALNDLPLI